MSSGGTRNTFCGEILRVYNRLHAVHIDMHLAHSAEERDDIVRVVAPEIASMTSGIAAEPIVKHALKYIPEIEFVNSGTWLLLRSEKRSPIWSGAGTYEPMLVV
jgi:hypothetical protein